MSMMSTCAVLAEADSQVVPDSAPTDLVGVNKDTSEDCAKGESSKEVMAMVGQPLLWAILMASTTLAARPVLLMPITISLGVQIEESISWILSSSHKRHFFPARMKRIMAYLPATVEKP